MIKKFLIQSVTPFIFIIVLISMSLLSSVNALSQIEVISHTDYIDEQGIYNIVGEVHNIGDQVAENITISATFFDIGEMEIGYNFSYASLHVLFPDEKSPFKITLLEESTSLPVNHYSLNIDFTSNVNYTTSFLDKIVVVHNDSHIDDFGYMHIAGSVDNTGELLSYFEVVGTFYDEAGEVVEVGLTSSDQSACSLPQTMPFEMIIPPENIDLISTYVLKVANAQGNYIAIPEFNTDILTILTILTISIILIKYKRKIKTS